MSKPQPEEVRIALVMNGGVSLAVWMGGVTTEIYRLVTQSHPVYRDILELTNSVAKVDVISGTSAGGVNGAALVIALLYGGEFESLREVWMETGALESLLSSPVGPSCGALLRGEQFFFPHIVSAFDGLACEASPLEAPYTDSIDLQLTTTLLTGRRVQTVDSLGTKVEDVDYRGHFRFRRTDTADDFKDKDKVLAALSRAARSTASFPFAFEPSQIDAGADAHLFDALDNPLVEKRHVVDGGILNNKPIRGALKAIFNMSRERGVRRVLAYINPDPGDGPRPESMADVPSLYSVLGASLFGIPQSQSIADQLQEIADHNREVGLRRDNVLNVVAASANHLSLARQLFAVYRKRRITNTCQLFILDMLPVVTSAEPGAHTPSVSDVCQTLGAAANGDREKEGHCPGDGSPAHALRIPELQDALAVLGKQGAATIKLTFESIEWDAWIPTKWPDYCDEANRCDAHWEWGLFPVEFSARVMLDLLRLTQRLADIRDSLNALAECDEDISGGVDEASVASDGIGNKIRGLAWWRPGAKLEAELKRRTDWEDRGCGRCDAADSEASSLARLWRRAYATIRALERQKAREQSKWEARAVEFLCGIRRQLDEQAKALRDKRVKAAQAGVQFTYVADPDVFRAMLAFLNTADRRRACARLASRMAVVVCKTCREARELIDDFDRLGFPGLGCLRRKPGETAGHSKRDELNGLMRKQLDDLVQLVEFFEEKKRPGEPDAESASTQPECSRKDRARWSPAHAILYRLLQLEVIQYSFNQRDELTDDTLVELVQISGNSVGPLGNSKTRSQAREKLLGIQVAHFAAFYKQSWRVNDWTFGRLDGAERLVKLLLNPERLQSAFASPQAAASKIEGIAKSSVPAGPLREYLDSLWSDRNYYVGLCAELSFLDNNRLPLPDELPLCAEVITIRLHLGILREELPKLVMAIEADQSDGSDASEFSSALVKLLGNSESPIRFSPDEAAQAYANGLISGERLAGQAGSDLFTRTLAHIVAASQRTLASASAKLGPISALSASVRVPILGFYLTARGLTRQSRTSAALNGALLVTGFVLVCLQFLWLPLTSPRPTATATSGMVSAALATTVKADPVIMPHLLVTVGWLLFAYGLILSILRSRMVAVLGILAVITSLALAPRIIPVSLQVNLIFVCALLVLAYIATIVVWLQIPIGFVVILAAGIAGTGEADCLGTDAFWHRGFRGGCFESWLSSPSVWLSLVIILALSIAVIDLAAVRRFSQH
ncbi:patatin-like protein [Paraburkholderia sp. BR10937]|uniref:patatin-like protein n=1 Tax=Paraburkholderia sp. BR10937 TaxID=3236994 RepID=UPI0034D2594D